MAAIMDEPTSLGGARGPSVLAKRSAKLRYNRRSMPYSKTVPGRHLYTMGYLGVSAERERLLYRASSPPEPNFKAIFGEPLGLKSSLSPRGEFAGEDSRNISSRLYGEHEAAVTQSGNQAPSIAVNSMASLPPQDKLPSITHSSTVLEGSSEQRVLLEVSSGTKPSPATEVARNSPAGTQNMKTRRTRTRINGVEKQPTEFRCEECTRVRSRTVSFTCKKDLERHKNTTKAHNAPAIAICRCGRVILRKDACGSHRRYCDETWLWMTGVTNGN